LTVEWLGPAPGTAAAPGTVPGPGGPVAGGPAGGKLPGETGKVADDAPATKAADGAAVGVGQWVYAGDNRNAINVRLMEQEGIFYYDKSAADDKTRLVRADVSVRNDTGTAWRYFNESTIAMKLLDADGQTVSAETRVFYPATGQRAGGYELGNDQRLNFVYDVAYPTAARPATLVLTAWGVSLQYKLGSGE
jgi:hypothetical protein